MEETTTRKTRKGTSNKSYRMYLVILAAILVLGAGGYFGYKYYQAKQTSPQAQAAQADAEKKTVLAQLSKLMVLPEGDPVLFKVNDEATMRKQQAFFKDTKNDDVLLVFQASSKAIIFRPSTNMIVNVGPINFDQNAATNPKTSAIASSTTTTSTTTKK